MLDRVFSGMRSAASPETIGFVIVLVALLALASAYNYGTEDAGAYLREKGVGA